MFRFTIRDVLWLTVVVALAIGWWRDHSTVHQEAAAYRVARDYMAVYGFRIDIEGDALVITRPTGGGAHLGGFLDNYTPMYRAALDERIAKEEQEKAAEFWRSRHSAEAAPGHPMP